MGTRKDKIIDKAKKTAQKRKITDIDTIFTRYCDFNENMAISDYRNEYSDNYRFAQMYNFPNLETWFKEYATRKVNTDPLYRLPQKDDRKRVTRQLEVIYEHVELINMGYDDDDDGSNNNTSNQVERVYPTEKHLLTEVEIAVESEINLQDDLNAVCDEDAMHNMLSQTDDGKLVTCQIDDKYNHVGLINDMNGYDNGMNNCISVPAENLICNEILLPSVEPEENKQDYAYEVSDDSRDKDYLPEEDLQSRHRKQTNWPITEDENVNCDVFQHCEFEGCKNMAISCCVKCLCLLCSEHFDQLIAFDNCKNHKAYSTGNNALPESQTEDSHNSRCQYENCDKEIFSTCGKCLCFLCYTHFEMDDTYNDCKKHIIFTSTLKYTKIEKQKKFAKKQKPKENKGLTKQRIPRKIDEALEEEKEKSQEYASEAEKKGPTKQGNSGKRRKCEETLEEIKEKKTRMEIGKVTQEKVPEEENNELTKKGNPRKRRKCEETLEERKEKKKRMEIDKLTLKDPCKENCKKKCTKYIDNERRKEINAEYVALSWSLKGCFIKSLVETKQVACRKTTNIETPKRDVTNIYHFYHNRNKIEVCKTFFLATLGYNPKNDTRLLLALKRPINAQNYQKGSYTREQKYDKELVKQHIMSYGPVNSHYRREHAPKRLYLPSDITITTMHQHFCAKHPEQSVSFEVYRKIVRHDMNISFAHLGNEECEICEHFRFHLKTHESQNEDCDICRNFEIHQTRYRESREAYQNDVEKSKANKTTHTIYYSVDLQKVVMLPRMDQFKRAIFCPRIIAFNESFVPLGCAKNNNIPFAAVWTEVTTGRKQEDIISTFNAFLLRKRDVENIVLWMDNCSSQNKNWALLSYLVYIINSDEIKADTITVKYFEPGHTYMSADSFHHQVEQALQRKKKVYDFADFVDAVQQANSRNTFVKTMGVADFYNFSDLSSQHKMRKTQPRLYLKDIMVIQAKRGEFMLRCKKSPRESDNMLGLDFLQNKYLKSRSFPEFTQKCSNRGILAHIKDGILTKLLDLMPHNRRSFWLNLDVTDEVENLE